MTVATKGNKKMATTKRVACAGCCAEVTAGHLVLRSRKALRHLSELTEKPRRLAGQRKPGRYKYRQERDLGLWRFPGQFMRKARHPLAI
jgi:hypothetical protein